MTCLLSASGNRRHRQRRSRARSAQGRRRGAAVQSSGRAWRAAVFAAATRARPGRAHVLPGGVVPVLRSHAARVPGNPAADPCHGGKSRRHLSTNPGRGPYHGREKESRIRCPLRRWQYSGATVRPRFEVPAALDAIHTAFGIDLARSNGTISNELPVPATFIIDRDGRVAFAFVDADYRVRLEPAELLRQLETVVRSEPDSPGR